MAPTRSLPPIRRAEARASASLAVLAGVVLGVLLALWLAAPAVAAPGAKPEPEPTPAAMPAATSAAPPAVTSAGTSAVTPAATGGPERVCAGRECAARSATPIVVWTPASWAALDAAGRGLPADAGAPHPVVDDPNAVWLGTAASGAAWLGAVGADETRHGVTGQGVTGGVVDQQRRDEDGGDAGQPAADPNAVAGGRLAVLGSAVSLAAGVAYLRTRSRRRALVAARAARAEATAATGTDDAVEPFELAPGEIVIDLTPDR